MGQADVNWLLAAMLQSGAAMVAIVGGFLASRYVSLDAQRNATQHRLEEAT